jgi:hypothetical protein
LEYVAGQAVMANVTPTPTDSFLASSDAITIGDVSFLPHSIASHSGLKGMHSAAEKDSLSSFADG